MLWPLPFKKVLFLALMAGTAIVAISFMKEALELEDAEQAYYSQWWRLGYDDQPPLYTWIQILLNKLFGVSRFSLSLFRGILFAGILLSLYKFAVAFLGNHHRAGMVTMGLVLVPTFMDFTFRRLSHTTLMCLMVVLTYWMVLQLIRQKSLKDYLLFGAIIGIGLLSKYNYLLVLGALLFAVPFDRELRRVLWHPYMFLTLFIALLCISPHAHWLLENQGNVSQLRASIQEKTGGDKGGTLPLIGPLTGFLTTLPKLFVPLLLVLSAALFWGKARARPGLKINWLLKVFLSQLMLLLVLVVGLNMGKVEARWLLPLLLPYMVLFPWALRFVHPKRWEQWGFYLFLMAITVQTLRTPAEKWLGIESSVHFGFGPIGKKLQLEYPERVWQLPNITYAGNIRLLYPGRKVLALDDYSLLPEGKGNGSVAVLQKQREPQLQNFVLRDSIVEFGRERETLYLMVDQGTRNSPFH
jgi:4-amino-4-deoxy-L-arabinose transferase-like glycosyltransferase